MKSARIGNQHYLISGELKIDNRLCQFRLIKDNNNKWNLTQCYGFRVIELNRYNLKREAMEFLKTIIN